MDSVTSAGPAPSNKWIDEFYAAGFEILPVSGRKR